MERIKNHLFKRFSTVFSLFIVTCISLFLLMIRLKITHSFFLLFLVWNIFLAAIPYLITFYMVAKKNLKKAIFLPLFGCWLLFLPNAPYIVTDLVHLQHLEATMLVLDSLLISFCALSGLLFYLISMRDMEHLLRRFYAKRNTNVVLRTIPFLSGLGIYLGRFMRWNSWDILRHPHILLKDVWEVVTIPTKNIQAWTVILLFGFGLTLAYFIFRKIPFFKEEESVWMAQISEKHIK